MRNKARQRGATLGAQLRRERLFVGRAGEREQFDRIVREGEAPTRIVTPMCARRPDTNASS